MATSSHIAASVAVLCCFVAAVSADFSVTVSSPAAAPSGGQVRVKCESTGLDAVLCLGTANPDTSGAARAFVLLAKENATETAAHLPRKYDSGNLEYKAFELQRCLEVCKKRYEAAVAYLGDAAAALDKSKFDDAGLLLGTAQAQVKLCQKACPAAVPQEELFERNRKVVSLCNVAADTIRKLPRHPKLPAMLQ